MTHRLYPMIFKTSAQFFISTLLFFVCKTALAEDFSCDTRILPKLAAVDSKKAYFFYTFYPDFLTKGDSKSYLKQDRAYVVRGDQVVLSESPQGEAERDGKCFASYVSSSGKIARGFLEKTALKIIPAMASGHQSSASKKEWQGIFSVDKAGGANFARLEMKNNSVNYKVIRGGNYGGEVIEADFKLITRSPTEADLVSNDSNDRCHLSLYRLNEYLYVVDKDATCGGGDYSFEHLLRYRAKK